MQYINTLMEDSKINGIYFCKYKSRGKTKTNKDYDNVQLQDKTGILDAKIWDPYSSGIDEYEEGDFVEVCADIIRYNGNLQANIKRLRKAGEDEYSPMDYFPTSEYSCDEMYAKLCKYADSVKNEYLRKLAKSFFDDEDFAKRFKEHSAAKTVHHSFIGGLTEHTLKVTELCEFLTVQYPYLNRDLMVVGGLFHDLGKLYELSDFPANDYTDVGQLIGHITYGTMILNDRINTIEGFPENLRLELLHCILAHHGEMEYGSPKKPALAEAMALNVADAADAKLQIMRELLENDKTKDDWTGYNKFFQSNIKKTRL